MAAIRGRGNKTTEVEFARLLRISRVAGWRRHQKGAYGSPDFLFGRKKAAIFVDGCFWHGCRKHCIMPKSNKSYWNPKIERNKNRDKQINKYYRQKGWKVLRIWEHDIRKKPGNVILKIKKILD